MDLSWAILICVVAALVIALVYLFFGYKLARFLLPLCGTLIVLAALWAFALDALRLDAMGTWLFMGGAGVSVYILLLFFRRIAGFFAGVLGAALLLVYIVYALDLSALPYLYPACFALCAVSGLLALVYKRAGVIVFASLLGACIAAFAGLYLYFEGVNPDAFSGNILVPLEAFLSANRYLIAGASLIAAAAGVLVQALVTGKSQMLPGSLREGPPEHAREAPQASGPTEPTL
jgi:hypothetical protein